MTRDEELSEVAALALRPDELHWVIHYISPVVPGIRAASIWSPNRQDFVRSQFLFDFSELRPVVLWMDFLEGRNLPRAKWA